MALSPIPPTCDRLPGVRPGGNRTSILCGVYPFGVRSAHAILMTIRSFRDVFPGGKLIPGWSGNWTPIRSGRANLLPRAIRRGGNWTPIRSGCSAHAVLMTIRSFLDVFPGGKLIPG
uniref:(northern house mosquito) hypothetical protein n=1 Tax=Culex pipiens TaxID=7175 RepID=A0A8D8ES11_CULPI